MEAQGPTKGTGSPPATTSQEPSRQGDIHCRACFHLPARRPSWGRMRAVPGLSCTSHHCSTLGAPWGCSPWVLLGDAASPLWQLIQTAQRGQWQHGGGSQMCECASVAQGNSQHRPCGQNAGIWVSPRHRSEGSGQREQPRWLPTATGEWDGGTEDGQCQHRPCCPTSGLGMLLPFPPCRPFRHHSVHP